MRLALEQASLGLGRTSPNPPVGAVIVRDGEVVAMGHHAKAGGPHAEAVALEAAGERARGADLYITLEPCDHQGKVAPCAPAIVAAGVGRVFLGTIDPNPRVSGRGVERLRRGGVEVEVGVLEAECRELIAPWEAFIRTGRPWVVAKVASTLDGRIATASGASQWITGEAARRKGHELRNVCDAILVGIGTARSDDPLLTCRIPGGRDPLRVVLDSRLELSPEARMLQQAGRTVVACVEPAPGSRAERLRASGAEILPCAAGPGGGVDVEDLLRRLGAMGVVSLLVEGGARVLGSFLAAERIDRLHLFYGPKVFGAGPGWIAGWEAKAVAGAKGFEILSTSLVDGDLWVEARLGAEPDETD